IWRHRPLRLKLQQISQGKPADCQSSCFKKSSPRKPVTIRLASAMVREVQHLYLVCTCAADDCYSALSMRTTQFIHRTISTLFAIAAAMSLIVCLCLVYFWVRSHYIAEVLYLKPVAASGEQDKPLPFETKTWQYQYEFGSCVGEFTMVRRHLQVGNEMTPRLMHLQTDDPGAQTTMTPRDPLDLHWKF